MKINPKYKLRQVGNENIIILPGDMTKVVAFNESAVLMWNSLLDRDFSVQDACQVLTDNYEIDEETARNDAVRWIYILKSHNLLQ